MIACMKYTFFISCFFSVFLLAGCTSCRMPSVYKYYLLDYFNNADINYDNIDTIDYCSGGKASMMKVFSPCHGKNRVVRYMSYDYGYIHDEQKDTLNSMIILSVDTNEIIIDGFLVFLQNGEYPASDFLLRTNKHVKLKHKMKIKDLDFYPYSRDKEAFELPFMQRRRFLGFLSSKKPRNKDKTTFEIFEERGREYRRYIKVLNRIYYPKKRQSDASRLRGIERK